MNEYIVRETGYPGAVKQEVVGELVRCKGCKWWKSHYCNVVWRATREDEFCCWGERKDDDKTQ